ncbi:hypothetical protein BH09PLA1_BH09PLA1_29810 [soil metagenome]
MMSQCSDQQLLDRFTSRQDQAALAEIVRRYIGLVNAAARRQVRDPHLAADITQAVFIVLVRKAPSLRVDTNLPAWLFTVTRHAVANARRVQARQRIHETHMATITREQSAPPADIGAEIADEIRSVLDDGLAKLSHLERASVLMHFFGSKSHREVGEKLGMTEEAARKRISRSLEKLRTFLIHRRGDEVTHDAATTSAALASVMISENAWGAAIAAQSELVASTANVALLANEVTATGASKIAQSVLRTIGRASRVRIAAAIAALLVLIGVTSIVAFTHRAPSRLLTASPPALAVRIGSSTNVEFIGASTYPPARDSWFSADGSSINLPDDRLLDVNLPTAVPPQYEVAVRIDRPRSEAMRLHVDGSDAGSNMMYHDGDALVMVAVFSFGSPRDTAKLELAIADGPWSSVAANDQPDRVARLDTNFGVVAFNPIATVEAGAAVVVQHERFDGQHQLVAIDRDGGEHIASAMSVSMLGPRPISNCRFDLPPEAIARIVLRTRPFSRFVDFEDVSLSADRPTKPTIKLREK